MNLAQISPPSGFELNNLSTSIGLRFASGGIGALFSGPTGIIAIVIAFAGILVLLYLIMGGIQFMTSAGDPKKAQGAKATITNAIVGLFLLLISFMIVQAIGIIFGLQGVTKIFG